MIRLLIADDHPVVRAGLAGLLSDEPGFEVVAEASDGDEAVRLTAATRPDVVLMDLRMPRVDGVAATARIAGGEAGVPAPRVLILTTYETDDQILAAQRDLASRDGVFVEPASAAGIAGLLQELAMGESYAGRTVVVTVTGHGLKDTATALEGFGSVVDTVVDANVSAAAAAAGLA